MHNCVLESYLKWPFSSKMKTLFTFRRDYGMLISTPLFAEELKWCLFTERYRKKPTLRKKQSPIGNYRSFQREDFRECFLSISWSKLSNAFYEFNIDIVNLENKDELTQDLQNFNTLVFTGSQQSYWYKSPRKSFVHKTSAFIKKGI